MPNPNIRDPMAVSALPVAADISPDPAVNTAGAKDVVVPGSAVVVLGSDGVEKGLNVTTSGDVVGIAAELLVVAGSGLVVAGSGLVNVEIENVGMGMGLTG
jgi:hypothetical protein